MTEQVIKSKQQALLDQYDTLYDDYVADLSAARFQKAGESQKSLNALEKDIYDNTLLMPTSENSGYLDLKSKMERAATAQAQEDNTKAKMDLSKFQYYVFLTLAAFTTMMAIRIIGFSSTPSVREIVATFVVISITLLLFN